MEPVVGQHADTSTHGMGAHMHRPFLAMAVRACQVKVSWPLPSLSLLLTFLSSAAGDGAVCKLLSISVLICLLQLRETNQMVEEMMLLANIAVAEKTLRHFASVALLRRHQTPPPRQ